MLIFMMIFIFTIVFYRKNFNIKVYNNTKQLYNLLMRVDSLENNKLNNMLGAIKILDKELYFELSNDFYKIEKEVDLLVFKYKVYRFDYDNFYDKTIKEASKMYINLMRKKTFKK